MAKNNKGFSLIEIVIAIAILTLLLTPVMKQFAQTMRTSRLAKEQQYINEEAIYALEEAQVVPNDVDDDKLNDIYVQNSLDTGLPYSSKTDAVECELVDTAGNPIGKVKYNVNTYKTENIEIGARNTLYNKIVKVDDLSAQVKGQTNAGASTASDAGYTIAYNLDNSYLSALPSGYTLTNEGSIVQYDADGNINKIVCETAYYTGNPNEINLGNMQNLDLDTVAMINGKGAMFDSQAEEAIFAEQLETLKQLDYDSWDQAINHNENASVIEDCVGDDPVKKVTKLYVDKLKDNASGKYYYIIKMDVYYISTFFLQDKEGNDLTGEGIDENGKFKVVLEYNVFSQRFDTEKCPDIYFEYQPFISSNVVTNTASGKNYNVTYADEDYIVIDNYVEGVKLYLYKPYNDAQNVANKVDIYSKDSYVYTKTAPSASVKSDADLYQAFKKDNAVNIHIVKANSSVLDKNTTIYTNLDTNAIKDSDKSNIIYNSKVKEEDKTKQAIQFYCDTSIFDGEESYNKVANESVVSDVKSNGTTKVGFNPAYIKSINEDTRTDDRLKSVTVIMEPVSGNTNTVRLSGAKGEK